MGCRAAAQCAEFVAAFEAGYNFAVGVFSGNLHELRGDPGEIRFIETQRGQRVGRVGIEAGGDQYQFGFKGFQSREAVLLVGLAELLRCGARGKGYIETAVFYIGAARVGVEGMLIGRAK